MSRRHILSAGLGLLALGVVATAARAAPVTTFAGTIATETSGASLVEKAHWYRRHYRHYYYDYYYPRYYRYDYYPRYYYRHHHHRYYR
jgi:hypothetical protein